MEEEEKISDDEKSHEGNCVDMFKYSNMSNVITDKTNLMF